MKWKQALFLICLIFVLASTGISKQIIYVDSSATGLNNGSSWMNAYTSLDSAFNKNSQLGNDDTIRVAKGTYRPSQLPRGAAATGDKARKKKSSIK